MHYFKAIKDGTIVDALSEPRRVFYSPRSGSILLCLEDTDPEQGIIGTDGDVYHVAGWPEFPAAAGEIPTVELEEIDVVTYEKIRKALDDPPDTDPVPPEGGSTDDLMTRAQLTAKVKALEASNARLEEELQAAKILLGVAE